MRLPKKAPQTAGLSFFSEASIRRSRRCTRRRIGAGLAHAGPGRRAAAARDLMMRLGVLHIQPVLHVRAASLLRGLLVAASAEGRSGSTDGATRRRDCPLLTC